MYQAIYYKWNNNIALTSERAVNGNLRSLDCKLFSNNNPETE